jgi:hypothetical protein
MHAGDRQQVHQSRVGVAVAQLARDTVLVGNEQCPHQWRARAEVLIDGASGGRARGAQPIATPHLDHCRLAQRQAARGHLHGRADPHTRAIRWTGTLPADGYRLRAARGPVGQRAARDVHTGRGHVGQQPRAAAVGEQSLQLVSTPALPYVGGVSDHYGGRGEQRDARHPDTATHQRHDTTAHGRRDQDGAIRELSDGQSGNPRHGEMYEHRHPAGCHTTTPRVSSNRRAGCCLNASRRKAG